MYTGLKKQACTYHSSDVTEIEELSELKLIYYANGPDISPSRFFPPVFSSVSGVSGCKFGIYLTFNNWHTETFEILQPASVTFHKAPFCHFECHINSIDRFLLTLICQDILWADIILLSTNRATMSCILFASFICPLKATLPVAINN